MTAGVVPTIRTWTDGEVVSAAMLNANVRDPIQFLLNLPAMSALASTAQSIPNATTTAINFDTTVNDSQGGHSTTVNPSRYTAQIAGYYAVIGAVAWPINNAGGRVCEIAINGAAVTETQTQGPPAGAANYSIVQTSGRVHLNVGDYVQILGYQSAGGALSLVAGLSTLQMFWVHA